MKAFLIGLIFLIAVIVMAGIGVLIIPLLLVLAFLLRVVVMLALLIVAIWLLGKFILFVWEKMKSSQ
ncbi:MAG: hypothetical protein ABII88_11705 [Candidatus Omnitrophota bacterium]